MKRYACSQRMDIGTRVFTSDDGQQEQQVGPNCYLHAKAADAPGWQPPGPAPPGREQGQTPPPRLRPRVPWEHFRRR